MNMNYIFLFLCLSLINSIPLNAMLQKVKNSEKNDYETLALIAARRQKPIEFSYFSVPPHTYFALLHRKTTEDPSALYYKKQSMEKKPLFFMGYNPLLTSRK